MRTSIASLALLGVLLTAPAYAEVLGETTPANAKDLAHICESARLTDIERRECRAMFKNAETETERLAAFRTFGERIYGTSEG